MNPLTTLREGVYKALYEKRDKDALSLDPVQDDVAFVFDETISRTLDLVSEEVGKMEGELPDDSWNDWEQGKQMAYTALLSRIQELKGNK